MSKWKDLKDRDFANLDCGDNSCKFSKNRTGMRTNGGCRCIDLYGTPHRNTPYGEMQYLANLVGEACDHIQELTSIIYDLLEDATCETNKHYFYDCASNPKNVIYRCKVCIARQKLAELRGNK